MTQVTHNKKPSSFYIGLDIGGTKCAIVLSDIEFNIYEKVFFETNVERGPTAIINEFKLHIHQLLEKYNHKNLVKIGISCGGPLNSKKGLIKSPPNLPGWIDIPIVAILKEEFGVDVALQNDANACALAEWMMGAGKGTENMIFLTFGTGMGAGLILNGKIYSGTNDLGGEVGHLRLADDGPVGFGKAGSFEGFCSGGGIAKLAKSVVLEKLQNNISVEFCSSTKYLDKLTAKSVFTAAIQGDTTALEIVNISAKYLGKALALLIDTLNPECIVIGSIYARNEALLKPLVYEVLEKEAIPEALEVCRILPAKLGDKIGDYAALGVAMQ
ncbi:ROK family protein [Aurantibacter crassamenti]|uniref:ROK family protein n=1 Tax=Aurantibacter crassamenti TaxID=1837375 RepID=UPI00193A2C89|nr:ROK family protein [Aurantibacter crassamenti]MBM1105142.1 ROK family protein [Aurantibacter crassamenti]